MNVRERLNRATQISPSLGELRDWYQRWVRLREARYQRLAEILDDVDEIRRNARYQHGSADPSSAAGNSHCIGVPSIVTGADSRRASPQGVRSSAAARSAAVSCACAEDDG